MPLGRLDLGQLCAGMAAREVTKAGLLCAGRGCRRATCLRSPCRFQLRRKRCTLGIVDLVRCGNRRDVEIGIAIGLRCVTRLKGCIRCGIGKIRSTTGAQRRKRCRNGGQSGNSC